MSAMILVLKHGLRSSLGRFQLRPLHVAGGSILSVLLKLRGACVLQPCRRNRILLSPSKGQGHRGPDVRQRDHTLPVQPRDGRQVCVHHTLTCLQMMHVLGDLRRVYRVMLGQLGCCVAGTRFVAHFERAALCPWRIFIALPAQIATFPQIRQHC